MASEVDFQAYLPSEISSDDLSLIDNIIIGTSLNDVLSGTSLNDLVIALAGDDQIIGSFGNDILLGGVGTDTVDYSELGQAITLEAAGFINKGRAGRDQLFEVESIIGAKGQANVIDASTSTSTTTSVDVNLSANSLVVNGVLGAGTLKFKVQNFVNVTGTSQNDTITGDQSNNLLIGGAGNDVIGGGSRESIFTSRLSDGNDVLNGGSGNDTLIGGTGNDFLDGGTGVDTADYSTLGNGITLEAVGVVNKGKAGTDQILNIETIVGATGRVNAIDGSTGTSTTTSFNVNLEANSLIVNGIPVLGTAKFTVQNFVNVTGTSQDDSIVGNSKDNLLQGGKGNDKISGLGGKDTIVGVNSASLSPGINEVDTLTGGADADKFVLGDEKNPYYVGGKGLFGLNDFGFITDFQTGQDQIQLKKLDNYIFGRNYIAIRPLFETTTGGKDFDDSQVQSTVEQIINSNGVYDSSSLGTTDKSVDSSVIFPSLDVVAIVTNGYSLNDIHFV